AVRRADAYLSLIDRTLATIEFDLTGTIQTANANFLDLMGYTLEEVVGKHHAIFVDPAFARTAEYRQFWEKINEGHFFSDQFPRLTRNGSVVWINATYAPCLDAAGKPVSVIKIATDITDRQNSINDIATGLDRLSEGDLSRRVPLSDLPDVRLLGQAYNRAVERLSAVIAIVKDVSQTVETTAREFGQSSADLSHRTEQQAATLEETAAAISELTRTVTAAATGAREVEVSASSAITQARTGGEVVQEAIEAMSEIEKSSDRIAKVIRIIDDIAFQTNLLALNAGVEAARAMEHGRGFAVVASEVRSLAVKSSDSAAEIKALIENSSMQVSQGVKLVSRAGDELDLIIGGVSGIHDSISAIARGASDQSLALTEINTGVAHLDTMTQQNAAMVEESTAASQTLARDASELSRQVGTLRVEGHRNVPTAKQNVDPPSARRRMAS
ncbi:MAG: methyl-accepting chemotaxis protein, partial [Jannaschia sp.]